MTIFLKGACFATCLFGAVSLVFIFPTYQDMAGKHGWAVLVLFTLLMVNALWFLISAVNLVFKPQEIEK